MQRAWRRCHELASQTLDSNKEQTPRAIYSIPPHGFTVVLSVFWAHLLRKPLDGKIWDLHVGTVANPDSVPAALRPLFLLTASYLTSCPDYCPGLVNLKNRKPLPAFWAGRGFRKFYVWSCYRLPASFGSASQLRMPKLSERGATKHKGQSIPWRDLLPSIFDV